MTEFTRQRANGTDHITVESQLRPITDAERYAPAYADVAQQIHKLAVETDTELARLWTIESDSRFRIESERARLDNPDWRGRELVGRDREQAEAVIAFHSLRVAEARSAAAPLEAVYAKRLWSRFFLCTSNSNGHIHSTMACSTTYRTTQFAWLPELSGLTEADAVEAQGEILCSVCFPSAPVAWTEGVSKATQAERDERAAKKAERDAKRVAKALFPEDPDKGIKTAHDTLRTIAAAKSYLTDAMAWQQMYIAEGREGNHPSFPQAEVDAVAALVAERTHTMAHLVLAAAAKRAQKRGW